MLSPNEVLVYVVSLHDHASRIDEATPMLVPTEVTQAERFLVPEARRRFILCRTALRRLLGALLGVQPRDVPIGYGKWGKPHLISKQTPAFHFNVSHSYDWGLVALARKPLGVDLEIFDARTKPRLLVDQLFNERERQAWEALPVDDQVEAILDAWVSKEALLKALGIGISEGLAAVTLPIPAPDRFHPLAIDPNLLLHLEDDGSCRFGAWIDKTHWRIEKLLLEEWTSPLSLHAEEPTSVAELPKIFSRVAVLSEIDKVHLLRYEDLLWRDLSPEPL